MNVRAATASTGGHILARDADVVAVFTEPGRNPMSPPDLSTDTPVLDIEHPFVVGLFPLFRHNPGVAFLNRLNRLFGQRLDRDVPLLAHVRFDDSFAPIALANGIAVIIDFLYQVTRFKISNNVGPGFVALLSVVGAAILVDVPRFIEDIYKFEIMPFANFKVIEIVCRRNLQAAA